ncbi:MAG TPA: precorrin-8X methylmutase, partial [Nitrosopumilaceae archaeon]|nr:precorrin-8X methylmutase [Nitrosopumilaceae archaeon]
IPFITNKGRKGGSSSAAAIINALYKLIQESSF